MIGWLPKASVGVVQRILIVKPLNRHPNRGKRLGVQNMFCTPDCLGSGKKLSDCMEEESKNMFFDGIFEKQYHVDFYHHHCLNRGFD
ncbi:hypothetical protein JCM14076_04330 [Methylosoma difficile]